MISLTDTIPNAKEPQLRISGNSEGKDRGTRADKEIFETDCTRIGRRLLIQL